MLVDDTAAQVRCSVCRHNQSTTGALLIHAAARLGVDPKSAQARLDRMHRDDIQRLWLHRRWEELLTVERDLVWDFLGGPVGFGWFTLRDETCGILDRLNSDRSVIDVMVEAVRRAKLGKQYRTLWEAAATLATTRVDPTEGMGALLNIAKELGLRKAPVLIADGFEGGES
jgi:hypothetical protein